MEPIYRAPRVSPMGGLAAERCKDIAGYKRCVKEVSNVCSAYNVPSTTVIIDLLSGTSYQSRPVS